MTKQITPVIKRTRVSTERYEVCPHCSREILEKSTFVDDENYVYHRACEDKGPIDQIKPCKIVWDEKGIRCAENKGPAKTAGARSHESFYRFLAGAPIDDVARSHDWPQTLQMLRVMGGGMSPEDIQKKIRRESLPVAYQGEWDRNHGTRTAQAEDEERSGGEFFSITTPLSNNDEVAMFTKVVNQGIDANLEAFTRSKFGYGKGRFGEPRLVMNYHVGELPILVRRLRELGTDEAESWAEDIESQPEYAEALTHPKDKQETVEPGAPMVPVTIQGFETTREEFDERFPDDETTAGTIPTIVRLAGGRFGLKIARGDLEKIARKDGDKMVLSRSALAALLAGRAQEVPRQGPYSVFDLFLHDWDGHGGYSVALVDARTDRVVDPFMNPFSHQDLRLVSLDDGARTVDGKFYIRKRRDMPAEGHPLGEPRDATTRTGPDDATTQLVGGVSGPVKTGYRRKDRILSEEKRRENG